MVAIHIGHCYMSMCVRPEALNWKGRRGGGGGGGWGVCVVCVCVILSMKNRIAGFVRGMHIS